MIFLISSPLTNQKPGNFNCSKTITKNLEQGTREPVNKKSVVKFVKMEFYTNSHQLQKPPKLPKHDVDPKIEEDIEETEDEQIEVQFRSEKGDTSFPAFSVPKSVTNDKLKLLLQAFKKSCPVSAFITFCKCCCLFYIIYSLAGAEELSLLKH